MQRRSILAAAAATAAAAVLPAFGQAYDTGISATEIKLGQSGPYSGPVSAYGIIPKSQVAYFKMVNDKGGINGRKVTLLSLDDAYSPPKAVEATRKLVEQDQVFAIFSTMGTPANSAIQNYLNQKQIPQIVISGAARFSDPAKAPWTLSIYPSYKIEGATFARYVLAQKPNAKIGILYQNDDSGRDFSAGFKQGLGAKAASMVVGEVSYETSDASIGSQLLQLKSAGADVVFNAATPKFAALAIKGMAEMAWKPLHLLTSPSSSIKSVIEPAGAANAVGAVTAVTLKSPTDPAYANDADVKEYVAFVKQYLPEADPGDFNVMIGYNSVAIMADLLRRAGNNLTRKNLMAIATNLPPTTYPLLLPGLKLGTDPKSYEAFSQVRLQRFDGTRYVLID